MDTNFSSQNQQNNVFDSNLFSDDYSTQGCSQQIDMYNLTRSTSIFKDDSCLAVVDTAALPDSSYNVQNPQQYQIDYSIQNYYGNQDNQSLNQLLDNQSPAMGQNILDQEQLNFNDADFQELRDRYNQEQLSPMIHNYLQEESQEETCTTYYMEQEIHIPILEDTLELFVSNQQCEPNVRYFECNACNFKSLRLSSFFNHIKAKLGYKKSDKQKIEYKLYLKGDVQKRGRQRKCASIFNPDKVKQTITKKCKGDKYQCSDCFKTFSQYEGLSTHCKHIHHAKNLEEVRSYFMQQRKKGRPCLSKNSPQDPQVKKRGRPRKIQNQ